MALTPEEQQELAQLEATIGTEQPSQQAQNLTNEEATELVELEAFYTDLDAQQEAPGAPVPVAEPQGPSQAASFLRNAAGFLKAPAAAATALINKNYIDKMYRERGLEVPSFTEIYNDARDVQEGILKEDMEHNPISSTLGKIAEVVTVSKGLGSVFKAPQTASKALTAARNIGIDATAAVTTTSIDALERAVMANDVSGLESLPEAVKESLLYTTVGYGALAGLGRSVGMIGTRLGLKGTAIADATALPARQEILQNTIGLNSKRAIKNLETMSVKYSGDANNAAFLDELDSFITTAKLNDEVLLKSPAMAQQRGKEALKEIGQGLEDAYFEIDNAIGTMAVPMNNVWKALEKKTLDIFDATIDSNGVITASVKANAEDAMGVMDTLKREFYDKAADGSMIARPKGLRDLWKMVDAMNNGRFRGLSGKDNVSSQLAGIIRDEMDSVVSNIPNTPKNYLKWVSDEAAGRVGQLNPQRNAIQEQIQALTSQIDEAKASLSKNASAEAGMGAPGFKAQIKASQDQIDSLINQRTTLQDQLSNVNKGLRQADSMVPNAEGVVAGVDMAGGMQSAQNAAQRVVDLKRKYSFGKDFVDTVLSKADVPKTETSLVGQVFKNSITSFGAAAGVAGILTGGPMGGIAVATAAGILRTFAKDAGKYANAANLNTLGLKMQKASTTMNRLADNISDPTVASWASAFINVVSNDNLSPDYVFEEIQSVSAKMDLYEDPLERSSDAVKTRLDSIINASKDPRLAEALVDMINNGEDIGPYMDAISKDPALSKLFKGGLGWDGRVYSPEDKQMLISQVSSNTSIPFVTRMRLIKEIGSQGIIPNMAQIPTRQPRLFTPRNKREPR